MKLLLTFYYLIILIIVTMPVAIAAKKTPPKVSIRTVCQSEFVECLNRLPAELIKTKEHQDFWYVLKIYEFESLFQLNYTQRLHEATAKYVDSKNIKSKEFQFLTRIYHAKTQFAQNNEKKGIYYLDKAKGLFSQLTSTISNPIYLIHYANIILVEAHRLKKSGLVAESKTKFLETKQLLLTIKKNYYQYNNPSFQVELYTNLSHCTGQLNQRTAAIEASKKAIFWAKENANRQQIGISEFNLARAYQNAKQYTKSRRTYLTSIRSFVESKDKVSEAIAYLRLIEVSKAIGDKKTIARSFTQLDTLAESEDLPERIITWKNELRLTK
ncbi:hypothetical protein KO525_09095 [Psychrosphaera sp. B3R10]|nr:hypothetical protein [Psychrosphaera sp. B3R10]MBU2881458.1 hypothetical protein [Psychrosphaera sp. I2R16]MBU2989530.1 hypothetical protein [Psychrosphaera sp. B3R10]